MRAVWPSFLLLIMGSLWGLQYAMIKLAAESGYNEMNILMLTLFLIAVFYGVIIVVRRDYFALSRQVLFFLVVVAVLGYILPLIATVYAASHVPAGIISLVASMTPILTVLLALLLRSEAVSRLRVIGVLLGSVSVSLILLPEVQIPGFGLLGWILLLMTVPFCFAIENIYVALRWPVGLSTVQMVAGEAVIASVLMLPLFFLFGAPGAMTLGWTNAELGIVIYVIAGLIEAMLYFYIIKVSGGVLVSFGSFISLFAGIAWGIVIFDESHPPVVWVAAMLLVVAVFCVSKTNRTLEIEN